MNLLQTLKNFKTGITVKETREKLFLLLSTIIFTFISLGCLITNFITREMIIAYVSSGVFAAFIVLQVLELLFLFKPNVKKPLFSVAMGVLVGSLSLSYVFLAPADSLFFFWICISPVCFCLSFGLKKGLIGSLALVFAIGLAFYIPGLYQLTRFDNVEAHWLIKAFFMIYYLMCTAIGAALASVNVIAIKSLDRLKDEYYQEANTDSLTGLRNQAYYLSYINNLGETLQKGDTLGLMFIDIDDFKLFNDKFGHTVGNDVLISVANKLNEVPHALCVRWGGDEFAIVEKNLSKDEFIAKANYLLKSVAALPNNVTISIGLAFYTVGDDFDFQKIFDEADLQAIRAKGKGKNCIVIKEI